MCNQTDEIGWSWAAGFFDGEGTTQAGAIFTRVRVAQNDIRPLKKLQSIAGGNITGPYTSLKSSNLWYQWTISNYNGCVYFLERVWPYLSDAKKEQAIKYFIKMEIERLEKGVKNIHVPISQ